MSEYQNTLRTSTESRETPRALSASLVDTTRRRHVEILTLAEGSPLWQEIELALEETGVPPVAWQWECELIHLNRCYFERHGLRVNQGDWETLYVTNGAWEELFIHELTCEVVCHIPSQWGFKQSQPRLYDPSIPHGEQGEQ